MCSNPDCQAVENTALGKYWTEENKLCSECGFGKWHGIFPKEKYDPNKWKLADGFLEEIESCN
jgi:hypothetical protein